MRYVPNEKPKPKLKDRVADLLGKLLLFAVLGPFAIVYLIAIVGGPMPGGWFFVWLLGVLTFGGIVSTWDLLKSVRMHGIAEAGCALPVAAVTCWFGWMLLRELGMIE